jgi:hypothetical protein
VLLKLDEDVRSTNFDVITSEDGAGSAGLSAGPGGLGLPGTTLVLSDSYVGSEIRVLRLCSCVLRKE